MNKAKQKILEKKGWKVSTAEEFLGLSPAETQCIEKKLAFRKTSSGHTLGTVGGNLRVRPTEGRWEHTFVSVE
jgi:hypothetical protein